ncbi:MAG: ATP-binding cassette domain-containing protein [Synergistaceae bacterium]|nr:ATP-binding cassette domain-containing protein [Synergistaceae bacterium]
MTERIKLDNVIIKYGDNTAINNISLKADSGEFIFITGANGSGKSTLTRAIAGLIKLDSGKIETLGKISYVPQIEEADRDFPACVKEIVITGTQRPGKIFYSRRDRELAKISMQELFISDLAEREIKTLSGGQLRRVFLARALCGEPDILLLDEPCAGLDADSHEILFSLLRKKISEGCTILMVTHDDSDLAGITNARVIKLSHGRII